MKRAISLALVLILCLSLTACGNPTLQDLLDCPDGSLEERAEYLKSCGCEIKNTTADYVTFDYGNWDGHVSALGISLDLSEITAGADKVDYDKEAEAMIKEVEELCGEPYSSRDNQGNYPGMKSSLAFYACGDDVIAVSESDFNGSKSISINIYFDGAKQ